MVKYISKSLWLLTFSVIICCVIYPGVLWLVGQTFFPFQANGSMVTGPDGAIVGSLHIAQPFTKDEYFQPRPSAAGSGAGYDASASSSQAWAASNYQLRNRVATQLGPIVKFSGGSKDGAPVAPDIEAWFQKDQFQGSPSIVAQWADVHNGLAQAWVAADPAHAQYVTDWSKSHLTIVAQYIKDNPGTPAPAPSDLSVVFFESFSKDHPGKFPAMASNSIQPVGAGPDIQSTFFDMWRTDHPDIGLQDVPGDMVTTSASGLDPNISMQNAEFQLDRVASKWAADTKRDAAAVRAEIEQMLKNNASAPLNGLVGESYVNVLQVNIELRRKYGAPT